MSQLRSFWSYVCWIQDWPRLNKNNLQGKVMLNNSEKFPRYLHILDVHNSQKRTDSTQKNIIHQKYKTSRRIDFSKKKSVIAC